LKESWGGRSQLSRTEFHVPVLEGISIVETRDSLSLDLAFYPSEWPPACLPEARHPMPPPIGLPFG